MMRSQRLDFLVKTFRIFTMLTLAGTVALASCDLPATFGPLYSDTGRNWIGHIAVSEPPAASDVDLDISARWDWAWRGKTGNDYQYMTLTEAGTTPAVTDGAHKLAVDTPAWRLELSNLFVNGTFEEAFDATAYSPSIGSIVAVSDGNAIHQKSLRIDLGIDADDYVAWLMEKLVADVSAVSGHRYQLNMLLGQSVTLRYRHAPLLDIDEADSFDATPVSTADSRGSLFIADSFTGFQTGSAGEAFAVNAPLQVTVDEVRAVRTDIDPSLRLLLAPWDTDPSPTYDDEDQDTRLTPGQYEFSVWLRIDDADRYFDDASRVAQPYAAKNVTLRMRQVSYEEGALEPKTSISAVVTVDATWRRYAVRMADPSNMDYFDDMTPHPVMELSIAPTLLAPRDAGAVLLAAPELNFYKDGF